MFQADDIFDDPHFAARNMLAEVDVPGASRPLTIAHTPLRMSETPGGVRRRAPLAGEDTDRVGDAGPWRCCGGARGPQRRATGLRRRLGHGGTNRQGGPRQGRLAARPLRLAGQHRQRAGRAGQSPEALTTYRASLGIADRLAKVDPGNAGWQRDLSISQEKIGDVLVAQGNLPEALAAYRASLGIADRLAKADPGNAGWLRDLSVAHNKIGDVLIAQGNLPEALTAYRASLAIRDRLAKADPGNAGWQRDLAISHGRVAMVLAQQQERERALSAFREGRGIIVKLKAAAPTNATLPRDLAWFEARIAELEK